MKKISIEELSKEKTLLYNIFDENYCIIFRAGEVLTPGKLLQLRQVSSIFRDEKEQPFNITKTIEIPTLNLSVKDNDDSPSIFKNQNSFDYNNFFIDNNLDINKKVSKFPLDSLDITGTTEVINKKSIIDPFTQIRIKIFHSQIIQQVKKPDYKSSLEMYSQVRDKILQDLPKLIENTNYNSELRLIGNYNLCHVINTAILSLALSKRLGISKSETSDIVMGALLHDIGKIVLPQEITANDSLSKKEKEKLETHTTIGYDIVKNKLKLSDTICDIVLNHHELCNGNGYPNKISDQQISKESSIVSVCNYFDNIAFNKTEHKVKNAREALRILLELGSQYFKADILYSFITLFSYNDNMSFEEMVL